MNAGHPLDLPNAGAFCWSVYYCDLLFDLQDVCHIRSLDGNKRITIIWQFGDSPAIYQTSALYEVFRKDDRTRFFEVGKGVPASEILLIRNEPADDAN